MIVLQAAASLHACFALPLTMQHWNAGIRTPSSSDRSGRDLPRRPIVLCREMQCRLQIADDFIAKIHPKR